MPFKLLPSHQPLKMEVGLTGVYRDSAPPPPRRLGKSLPSAPSTPSKTVNFSANQDTEKKREKFLTAKYGAHQMALIRKRLRVEMWMYDQLQTLYTEDETSNDIEIDLDEVLDIDDDNLRKKFIRDILIDSKSSREVVNKFVEDLLERAKTL
jgi:protein phosphatase 1 regulatory subunit 14B